MSSAPTPEQLANDFLKTLPIVDKADKTSTAMILKRLHCDPDIHALHPKQASDSSSGSNQLFHYKAAAIEFHVNDGPLCIQLENDEKQSA